MTASYGASGHKRHADARLNHSNKTGVGNAEDEDKVEREEALQSDGHR